MRPVFHTQDTIAAIATPAGPGAIGVIRLSGPHAIAVVDAVFSRDLGTAAGHTLHFGKVLLEDGRVLDEVLVGVFRAPRSYTREDVCEVSFHGSPWILREAMALFARHGARPALAGEFTQRAYLNGAMDLAQAEAVADLIASSSARAHALAYKQMRGGVSAEISRLRERLLHFTSLLELELDFAEEDVEFADRSQLMALVTEASGMARRLASTFAAGNAIKEGVATVIAGRPNAGKSTLLNALLQEERAIVSDIPGTTRDTIEEAIVIDGVRFRLTDTAGIREAQDQVEAIGVQRTFASIERAAIFVYVYDAAATTLEERNADIARLAPEGVPQVIVANKWDKVQALHDNLLHHAEAALPADDLAISAKSGEGIAALREALVRAAIGTEIDSSEVIITNARHQDALQRAAEAMESASHALQTGLTQELVALDIRHAIHYLGEITGEITTDEVLGNIFSKFCIGK